MNHLKNRIAETVAMILTDGDRKYLRSLSRVELLNVLEKELRFFGTYALDDDEAEQAARTILKEQIDQYCEKYLYAPEVNIQESYCVAPIKTVGAVSASTLHFGFSAIPIKPQIQQGVIQAES